MKNQIKYWAIFLAVSIIFAGCSMNSSRDQYFGYTTKPVAKEETKQDSKQAELIATQESVEWKNPLAGNYYENSNNNDNSIQTVYYPAPMYVPVIVPWWDAYYGWNYYPSPTIYAYYRNGWWGGFDWYSPWYDDYHYYGHRWGLCPHYGYHSWWNMPHYTHYSDAGEYRKPKEKTVRTFGPSRGSALGNASATGSSTGRSSSASGIRRSSVGNVPSNNSPSSVVPSSSGSSSSPRSVQRSIPSSSEPARRSDNKTPSSSQPTYTAPPSGSGSHSGSSGSSSSGSSSSGSSSSGSSSSGSTTERSSRRK